MKLSEIATVSGKGGLFKVLSATKSGVILESLDAAKSKLVVSANQRLSLLHEISMYTTDREGSVPLEDILKKIHQELGQDTGIDGDASPEELKSFMKSILPNYDGDRVYVSDIKKLVKWYGLLMQHAPETILAQPEEDGKNEA